LLRVINLANFALAFLGAYLTYQLATALRLDPILTLAVIVPAFFVVGIALEEGFLRLRIDELTSLIVTFGLQAVINMASTLHLIPTKGMTLPFLSYGGSSMLALGLGMGMMLALTRRRLGGGEL